MNRLGYAGPSEERFLSCDPAPKNRAQEKAGSLRLK
jgi:hypothetical protein